MSDRKRIKIEHESEKNETNELKNKTFESNVSTSMNEINQKAIKNSYAELEEFADLYWRNNYFGGLYVD